MKTLHIILLLFFATNIWAQKLYVVSVGICDYKDPQVNDLRFTEADVASFNYVIRALYSGNRPPTEGHSQYILDLCEQITHQKL